MVHIQAWLVHVEWAVVEGSQSWADDVAEFINPILLKVEGHLEK